MHLLQQLTEQADLQQEVEGLIHIIKQAQPFFEKRGTDVNNWFFRGIPHSMAPRGLFAVESARPDRQPKDVSPELHKMMDDRLLQDFGHRFRSEATFVVNDQSMASDYGDVCIILPLGKFDFIYSKQVRDAYNILRARNLRAYIISESPSRELDLAGMPTDFGSKAGEVEFLKWVHSRPELEVLIPEWFERVYNTFGYTKGTLESAMASQNEIMLRSPTYAIIPRQKIIHPNTMEAVDRVLGTKLALEFDGYPSTMQLINKMIESGRIFK